MSTKLALTFAIFAFLGGAAYAGDPTSKIYKKEGKDLSCSLTMTGDVKQYFISTSDLTAMKTMEIVRCLGKATRQQPKTVKEDEVLIHANIFANVGGLRCYKGKKFILKFTEDIPDDLERLIGICFLRAAYKARERMESNSWT